MSVAMTDWITRHRITVDEYHRMFQEGILSEDARVELIEGEIIDMEPAETDSCGGAVMTDWITRHRISVRDYYRMAEVGILSKDARVELIEGEIIDMSPIGSSHAGTVAQLSRLLHLAAGDNACVRTQSPVRLSEISEPEPDLALLMPREDFYKSSHPGPGDIFLIIEVSDSSLRYDLQVKAALYARHAIAEYWVINLPERQISFFHSPKSGEYTGVATTTTPGLVAPVALPNLQIDLTNVLDE